MIENVKALKGEARSIKENFPFLCPDEKYIGRMLNSSKAIVILAKNKGNIVGAIGGWLEGTPSGYRDEDRILREHNAYAEAHLDWIAVREEYREKGLGADLVHQICKWARKNKKTKIWVETSEGKAAFYQKQTFQLVGRFTGEEKEEYLTMLKQL